MRRRANHYGYEKITGRERYSWLYITAGVILSALGLYDYLVEIGGSGARPYLDANFGYALVKGTMPRSDEISGLTASFTGGA